MKRQALKNSLVDEKVKKSVYYVCGSRKMCELCGLNSQLNSSYLLRATTSMWIFSWFRSLCSSIPLKAQPQMPSVPERRASGTISSMTSTKRFLGGAVPDPARYSFITCFIKPPPLCLLFFSVSLSLFFSLARSFVYPSAF